MCNAPLAPSLGAPDDRHRRRGDHILLLSRCEVTIRPSRQVYTVHCSNPPGKDVTCDKPGNGSRLDAPRPHQRFAILVLVFVLVLGAFWGRRMSWDTNIVSPAG